MSDAEVNISTAGFSTRLWIPEFGWEESEAEASEQPHPPQMLAALQCFIAFFAKPTQKVWVHLAAEMQAGKTGVVTALVRLVLSNVPLLGIRPTRIFVLTGMGDNAWKKQTRNRLPQGVRMNVHHSGGLAKVARTLRGMAVAGELSNVLIILDESHLAAGLNNRPNMVYDELRRLCPEDKWQENNIRILTISATDPAKVLMVQEGVENQVVRLQTTETYQSVESLHTSQRIRYAEKFGHLDSNEAIAEIKRCVTEEFASAPLYHIVRARTRGGKQEEAMAKLREAFPGADVRKFDSEEKLSAAEEENCSLSEMDDINEILQNPPEVPTFIVLKNMFYAGKTFDDTHVGILFDRLGNKDDTNLQSLLGRACGYGKSKRTIVYTSQKTVDNYISFWRELCSNPRWTPTLEGIPVSQVDKKMTGVRVHEAGGAVHVTVARNTVGPSGGGGGGYVPPATSHQNCEVTLEEFPSMAALNSRWSEICGKDEKLRTPNRNRETGEYICSLGKKSEKQTASEIRAFAQGTAKGWGSGLTNAAIGEYVSRVYAGYDGGSAIFFLRWTKKA